jgi:hypothetical protein
MEPVNFDILPFRVALAEDVDFFSNRLQEAENSLFSLKDDWQSALKQNFTATEFIHISQHLHLKETTPVDEIVTFLNQMTTLLSQLPSIDFKIAFPPTRSFADKITNWFDQYGPGPGRLNLIISPEVIGGAIIGYQGRVHNYSLAKQIDYDGIRATS